MKIKRYVESDMRQVLRRVREDQGPDAVIISNRRVPEGIEVIAAVDYDEALMQQALGSEATPAAATEDGGREESTLATADRQAEGPDQAAAADSRRSANVRVVSSRLDKADDAKGAVENDSGEHVAATTDAQPAGAAVGNVDAPEDDGEALRSLRSEVSSMRGILETQLSELLWKDSMRRTPARAQVLRNLTKLGLGPDIANMCANRLGPISEPRELWRTPLLELARMMPLAEDDLLENGGVAALVGPTGVGKTTTIAKLAFRYAIQHGAGQVALVSADAHRIGAQEHLTTFAKLLGVPVYPAEDLRALEELLDQLNDKSLVLIDTEGTSQRDVDLSARLAAYGQNQDRVRFYLTLAATCQEAGLDETVRVFNRLPLAGAIVTKIDEAAQLGCVMGSLIRHDLPAAFLADGQRVPDDLYAASNRRLWLVNQAVDCMRSSDVRVTEDMMVEKFAAAGAAHA